MINTRWDTMGHVRVDGGGSVKAFTLTPPWPNAIIRLGMRVVNCSRWRRCVYRGSILLHAAKGIGTRSDFDDAVEEILRVERAQSGSAFEHVVRSTGVVCDRHNWWRPGPATLRGGIFGRARIVDVIDTSDLPPRLASVAFDAWIGRGGDPDQRRWWAGGFALVLDDVEPLPGSPRALRGTG